MDPPDNDIQFDFFEDEPVTAEAPPGRMRLPRRPGRGPRRPSGPTRGGAPLVRLIALAAVALVVVLVFALLIQSCAGSSKHDVYASYMDDVDTIASQSTNNGKATVTALTTPGLTLSQMVSRLRNIAGREQQNVDAGAGAQPAGDAPGRAREPDRGAPAPRERRQRPRRHLPADHRLEDVGQ